MFKFSYIHFILDNSKFSVDEKGLIRKYVNESLLIQFQNIYQQFYKPSSAADQGTLFQLRNVLQRRDVSGPDGVTEKFR